MTACTTDTANNAKTGFSLSGDAIAILASQAKANDCTKDYLIFAGGYNKDDASKVSDRFCGSAFNPDSAKATSVTVCSESTLFLFDCNARVFMKLFSIGAVKSFAINYVTNGDENDDVTGVQNIGFCFAYQMA